AEPGGGGRRRPVHGIGGPDAGSARGSGGARGGPGRGVRGARSAVRRQGSTLPALDGPPAADTLRGRAAGRGGRAAGSVVRPVRRGGSGVGVDERRGARGPDADAPEPSPSAAVAVGPPARGP